MDFNLDVSWLSYQFNWTFNKLHRKEIINKNSTWKYLNVNNTKEHITSDIIIDINNSYYLLKLSQNRLIDNNCYSYQEPKIIKLIAFDGHM